MFYKNYTEHIGNIGMDVELHYTTKNVPVVSFSLAIIDKYKTAEGVKERKTWVPVVAYDKVAQEFAGKPKGTKVLIEGRLQTKGATVEVVVQNFMFL